MLFVNNYTQRCIDDSRARVAAQSLGSLQPESLRRIESNDTIYLSISLKGR
jgi:hypothetical protein